MNEVPDISFESHVRSQLEAVLIIVKNIQKDLQQLDGKSDKILFTTEEVSKQMLSLPAIGIQTNSILENLGSILKNELRDARTELKDVNKANSNKFSVKSITIMFGFIILSIAIIQGVTFEGYGTKFSKPVVDKLAEEFQRSRQAADVRAEKSAQVILEAAGKDK